MKENYLTMILAGLFAVAFVCSCGEDGDENQSGKEKEQGFAPGSIDGKIITFNRNGTWNFESDMQGEHTNVRINADVTYIAYDKSDPECTYRKTGDNTAVYTLEFWHKAYVPYYGSYSYAYNYYSLSLTFTSASGGTYTGTRNNGSTTEKREGTFSVKDF